MRCDCGYRSVALLGFALLAGVLLHAGESPVAMGNTDCVGAWRIAGIAPGETARRRVAIAFATGVAPAVRAAADLLECEVPAAAGTGDDTPDETVRIRNDVTDFALQRNGAFFWEGGEQCLGGPHGGQLSRFGLGLSYRTGKTRVAASHALRERGSMPGFALRLPVVREAPDRLRGELEAGNGTAVLAYRAFCPPGVAGVVVEFGLHNPGPGSLDQCLLTVYANPEAAHTHEQDACAPDGASGAIITADPTTGTCIAVAGAPRFDAGYAGQWPSEAAAAGSGLVAAAEWGEFREPDPAEIRRLAAAAMPNPVAPRPAQPAEPVTRTLDPAEADDLLVADWLFQAGVLPRAEDAAFELDRTLDLLERRERAGVDIRRHRERAAALRANLAAARANPTRPAPPPGPVVAYRSYDDDSSRGRRIRGVHGYALRAAGGEGEVLAEVPADLPVRPYTLCAWIRTTAGEADVIGSGTSTGSVLLMGYRGTVRGHQWTAAGLTQVDGTVRIDDGAWHHIAQVFDGTALRVYADGALDGEAPLDGPAVASPGPFYAGARSAAYGQGAFTGSLDELLVIGRALSAEEIRAEFGAGSGAVDPRDPEAEARYLEVRRLKRDVFFSDPALDFEEVLFIDNPYPQGREWRHQARHRNGMMAVPGGRLLRLRGLHPGGEVTRLAPGAVPGSFWRFDLSFDARKILYCFKAWDEPAFHLYEMAVDGSASRQLTDGPYDDTDPIYTPDGRLLFTTSRCNTYVRCMPYTYSYVLASCDPDGGNIRLISGNNEPDWLPTLLNDGRVIYSRWEYHDKALWRIQSLWTVNPDGTGVSTFWGNQSVWPDHLAEPRPIPGSRRVMFTGLAHHDWFAGSIGILDPAAGNNFPLGLTKVTAEVPWPECGAPPADPTESADYVPVGNYTAFKTPYPISEDLFLVSARRGGEDSPFVLLLMDLHGNRELIWEGAYNVWHAMPLKPRPVPPRQPDRPIPSVAGDAAPGILYSNDVCAGVPDLPRDRVRYLRIIQMDPRTYSLWNRDSGFSGPRTSLVQSDGVRRILGTVPVGADGSVAFRVPAGAALHFQLLDGEYRALQTMRSFTGVMPGEVRGCVGCHEQQYGAPGNRPATVLRGDVPAPTPPPWGTVSLSYERMIQPLLDRNCGSCHQGEGKARKHLDLTLRPGYGPFKEPYVTLVGVDGHQHSRLEGVPGAGAACPLPAEAFGLSDPASYVTFRPLSYLSPKSLLVAHAGEGTHHGVRMPPDELRLLTAWVDANCPYRSDEDVRELPDPDFAGIDALPVRPRVKTAPIIARP